MSVRVVIAATCLLLVLLIALTIIFGNSKLLDSQATLSDEWPTQHPTEVGVARLVPQSHYEQTLEFPGRLMPKRATRLGFEFGGLLLEPVVEVGQVVTIDQELASLDTQLLIKQQQQLQFQIERAQALLLELETGPRATTIRAAEAEVAALLSESENAKRTVERLTKLAKQDAVSEQEFENAVALEQALLKRYTAAQQRLEELVEGTRPEQLAAQRAMVMALTSEAESLQVRIDKSTMRAPFSGVIVKQYAAAGQVLAPGEPLFDFAQTETLEAQVGVSAEVAAQLEFGKQYRLHSEREWISATLQRIVPVVDAQTQTVLAIFEVDLTQPQSKTWIPGRLIRLRSELAVPEAGYWIPNDALVRSRRGLWAVYELIDDQSSQTNSPVFRLETDTPAAGVARVRQQQVEVLHSTQERSYVRGTLKPGSWIVVAAAHRLLDGQQVQVMVSKAASTSSALGGDQ